MENKIKTVGENYPCGPCELPLVCVQCGTVITEENVVNEACDDAYCEVCQYCGIGKCPKCGAHWHCGGCI